jgi:hypothetical protein
LRWMIVARSLTCPPDGDVIDPKADEIAAPKLAVDGEVERGQIAFVVLDLKSDANGPDLFRP